MALVIKNPPANAEGMRDSGSVPGSGRSPGGGNGKPGGLQSIGLQRVGHAGIAPAAQMSISLYPLRILEPWPSNCKKKYSEVSTLDCQDSVWS